MTRPEIPQQRFRLFDLAIIGLGALALNLVVFGAASLLQREVKTACGPLVYEVQAFLPDEPPLREPEKPKPPEKKEPPKMELKKLKVAAPPKERVVLKAPALNFDVNTKLTSGLDLGPAAPTEFGLGDVDQSPIVTGRVPPLYPYHAKRQGIEGVVTVRFLVDKKGRVSRVTIVKAEPKDVFENAVIRSVARWRFKPGYKDGRPVDTWVETDIEFELEQK